MMNKVDYRKPTFEFRHVGNLNRETLEPYLLEVWQQRFAKLAEDLEEGEDPKTYQGILSFDGNEAKAKNYIGFIQTDKEQIEIYPKVFRDFDTNESNVRLFIKHLFFWFDYCKKWNFPFTKNNLSQYCDYDLPELIISIMADRIREVISVSPISLYEEIEESLAMPRGRINFTRYISNGFSSGNYHIIDCDVEPLQYDNKLNRIIKYVTRLLLSRARFSETRRKLDEILFILDEVEDVPCTLPQLNTIKVNSFYEDYLDLIDICRLVLEQQVYTNQYYDQTQWCLLFPMEYIFEDFITGFLETEFKMDWKIRPQKSDRTLTDQGVFKMRHDIFLESKGSDGTTVIIDTKYKLRSPQLRKEKKKGVLQSDLYQITSYAFRTGCKIIVLLYPNYYEAIQQDDYFSITSEFNKKDKIHVLVLEVPFWSMSNFSSLRNSLKERLNNVLRNCIEISNSETQTQNL